MNKVHTLARQLADTAEEIKSLKVKEEALKDLLKEEMHKEGKEKESFDFGTVSVATRKSYTYSDTVKKLEDKVKMKKVEEERQGIATEKVTEYVMFRSVSENMEQI